MRLIRRFISSKSDRTCWWRGTRRLQARTPRHSGPSPILKIPLGSYESASITRFIAGCFRFFTLIECIDSASLLGQSGRFGPRKSVLSLPHSIP